MAAAFNFLKYDKQTSLQAANHTLMRINVYTVFVYKCAFVELYIMT